MKIFKFGGTSVGSPERMKQVSGLITADQELKIVVLSAVSGTTNSLVEICDSYKAGNVEEALGRIQALKAKYAPFVDELLSSDQFRQKGKDIVNKYFGEIERLVRQPFYDQVPKIIIVQGELISTNLFQAYMDETFSGRGKLLSATDFMMLNSDGEPDIPLIKSKLEHVLSTHHGTNLFITQGFICRNASGGIDNLKRGGSDYSATLIGAALNAAEVQIWTDIDGMHNNDPRVVKKTRAISDLSFEEASELAYFGAKILHPYCIIPAQQHNVPVRIKNTMDPNAYGTLITSEQNSQTVKAIAAKDGITAIKIKSSRMIMAYGFLRKIFEVFEKYKTPIDMITTSEVAVSLTIDDPTHLNQIVKEISAFGKVEVDRDHSIICIVGDLVAERKGMSSEIFNALDNQPIRMIAYGGSRNNISLLVDTRLKADILNILNEQLFDFT